MNSSFSRGTTTTGSTTASSSSPTSNGVNAECLILSASKRTFDSCVNELGNRLPEVVKSVVNHSINNSKRNEVFRDGLLSFVSFQTVFWRDSLTSNVTHQQQQSSSDYSIPPNNPNVSHYLVLGYINGVQVWRIQQQSYSFSSFNASSPSSFSCLPTTERVVGFRTLSPVTSVQLLPDIPLTTSTSSPHQQPSCRLAVVQHRSDGCNAVDIFSASVGSSVHVLQQPWPVVRLAASLSWFHSQGGHWIGTLVVATTQQIRIYDTSTFEIRFTISDFQSISLPPLWRWLAADTSPTVDSSPLILPFSHHTPQDPLTADDPPKTRSSGPIFTLGSRWIIYQTAAPPSHQVDHQSQLSQSFDTSGIAQNGTDLIRDDDNSMSGMANSWMAPATIAWKRFMSSPTVTRLTNTRLPRPLDLLLDQTGGAGTLFPVVESHLDRHHDWMLMDEQLSGFNIQPVGGPIVIVDLVTGEVVGHVDIGSNGSRNAPNGTASMECLNGRSRSTSVSKKLIADDHSQFVAIDGLPISEVQDGSWWLSHIDNPLDHNGIPTSSHRVHHYEGDGSNDPDNSESKSVPFISYMSLDQSGTTLFCTEWTGRTTWVIRFTASQQQQGSGPLSGSSNNRICGIPVYELFRGLTVGSVVDVSSSNNSTGDLIVVVASSRGSGHCFALPSGFHQTQFDTTQSTSLLFPSSLSSALPSTRRHSKRPIPSSHNRRNDRHLLNESGSSFSDSDDDNDDDHSGRHPHLTSDPGSRSSHVVQITPPRLSLQYSDISFVKGNKLPRRRAVCRINLLSSNKQEDANFYWKVSFLPSPFFRPYRSPSTKSPHWSLRRSFKIRWQRNSTRSSSSSDATKAASNGDLYLLPFLVASSDGVIDFCHAEFASDSDVNGNHRCYSLSMEQTNHPASDRLLPSLVRNPSSSVCLLADDDDDDDDNDIDRRESTPHPISIEHSTPLIEPGSVDQRQYTGQKNSTETPVFGSWFPNIKFIKTSIAHSLSTRDMELIGDASPQQSTSSPIATKTAALVWARHCEAITAHHREYLFTVKFISESVARNSNPASDAARNSNPASDAAKTPAVINLNQLFRSGDSLRSLFAINDRDDVADEASQLRYAIDAALNAPITTASPRRTPSTRVDISTSSTFHSCHPSRIISPRQTSSSTPFSSTSSLWSQHKNRPHHSLHTIHNHNSPCINNSTPQITDDNYVLFQY